MILKGAASPGNVRKILYVISTPARSRDRAALARARGSGMGLPRVLRKWTLEARPAAAIRRSFLAER
jgi:hypothetical protein